LEKIGISLIFFDKKTVSVSVKNNRLKGIGGIPTHLLDQQLINAHQQLSN